MYNNKNIVLHELIGLNVNVIKSADASQEGISGAVIDETKNTLIVRTKEGNKRVIKRISRFKFIAEKKRLIVEGSEIAFRPHERIEKCMKYYKRRHI